jgi:hypothetical protein
MASPGPCPASNADHPQRHFACAAFAWPKNVKQLAFFPPCSGCRCVAGALRQRANAFENPWKSHANTLVKLDTGSQQAR